MKRRDLLAYLTAHGCSLLRGVNAEELAQAAVADLVSANTDDFESAVARVLEKKRELYRRLAT